VFDALRSDGDPITLAFIDNTDADGMSRALKEIDDLGECLCIVISKSGGTRETQNGCAIAKHMFEKQGHSFAKHAVAITGEGSTLFQLAKKEGWMEIFPMWDWVGGRTSELSAVGLLPAALQGLQIDDLLSGAQAMDALTREAKPSKNPACLLAAAWYIAGDGVGKRDMVVLPYKDRLLLFSRYLQQLVMESLGKEKNLLGETVHQGLSVFGNKGSTDQHAYVQQLRDGLDNFFAVFIEVFQDHLNRSGQEISSQLSRLEVEPGVTCGDYLTGFCQGTKEALTENNRLSLTISLDRLDEKSIGGLVALFERAVGLYASMIGINAYHQPGVEAGKKAAGEVLSLQGRILQYLSEVKQPVNLQSISQALGMGDHEDRVMVILRHLAANGRLDLDPAESIFDDKYSLSL
jgi:glucose-6-phosphate isomerase